ncbi:C-MYB, putative [Entamoeba invadens IP1]|uniref:C-MYB, putative n=1 Tax=Entamoeba invadens IP1 TaxID=370355 RepID=A0A0A1TVL1_ENTIV|nr:C-MYB, putative [Entamoeba invadens IP1]ELP84494.1 C-MYB, putative [Entamoeba invadens IP1]|eukprot:XP_004183840.1 C-MYB, putative [Entamoeba invadens IP1]
MSTRARLSPISRSVRPWDKEEDARLLEAVRVNGDSNWEVIERCVVTRSRKQCRERYHNHLKVSIQKGDWTVYEDNVILEKVNMFGRRWTHISSFLPHRAPNSIKNRFYSHLIKHLNDNTKVNKSHSDSELTEITLSAFVPTSPSLYKIIM